MELIKDNWTKLDIEEFNIFLKTFSKGNEKAEWEQRIINTKMPCIAVPSEKVRQIVRTIAKGNYISFIDLWPWDNATTTFIVGGLICKIKDFDTQKKYLVKYSNCADNWATIDTIKPKITDRNRQKYVEFASECVKSDHTFVRRLGVILLLKALDDSTINETIEVIKSLYSEKEYYVNMAVAWLTAECFTKHKDKTILLFENGLLNKFVNNKTISKCHDSFRVSDSDKFALKNFRIK
ncbi:MAG: DNA alkylation repair protein [Clostridia bacterium]|nr:DNA alkylation repair protein [Clostridia bacterium]